MKNKRALWLCLAGVLAVWLAVMILCAPKVKGYELHSVSRGDTLWSIAKEYNPGYEHVDEVVYKMKKANGMKSSAICAGDLIQVPIMK